MTCRRLILAAGLLASVLAGGPLRAENGGAPSPTGLTFGSMAEAVAEARRKVVVVLPEWPSDAPRSQEPEGSGVVVGADGLIATADHVIGPADRVRIRLENGAELPAAIVLRDRLTDIALLKVEADLPAFDLKASDVEAAATAPRPADPVCAIGNAFGLGLSVSCGVVAATARAGVGFNAVEDFLQSDASVNPGASGGALIGPDGRLAGVLSAIFTKGTDADIGVNFTVSSELLRAVLRDYRAHGEVRHPALGADLAAELARIPEGVPGLRVRAVEPGGPAARAGLEVGDLIVAAGGRSTRSIPGLRAALLIAGRTATLRIQRLESTLEVRLERQ